MAERSDKRVHGVAQALCFAVHGDWRYDPGKKSHLKRYYDRAEAMMARFEEVRRGHASMRGATWYSLDRDELTTAMRAALEEVGRSA
jgi:hypothetical protein